MEREIEEGTNRFSGVDLLSCFSSSSFAHALPETASM